MGGQWEGGKGDRRRKQANDSAYAEGWNRVFGGHVKSTHFEISPEDCEAAKEYLISVGRSDLAENSWRSTGYDIIDAANRIIEESNGQKD